MVGAGPGFPIPFGRYVLLSSFGRGGMGEVFLAKTGTEGIERVCVLKTVRADHAGVEEYARRFLDEARVAVQLNHANICHVFDVGRVDDTLYLAMEYIPGVNIRDLLTRLAIKRKGLNPGLSLYFVEELLGALAYAHRQAHPLTGEDLAVVHRDISPHNVMVNFEGEVKLIDFGLAASSLKEENTESHLVMGKVAYMAPEQATGVHIDGRVDQFATGIMMYELLSGERYYGQMATHEVWQIVGRGGHVPRKWDTIPAAVQGVISRALHPDYSRRYADCEVLREEVAKLRAKLSPGVGKPQARLLMQAVYAERIEQQRLLLRSFADVPLAPEARRSSTSRPNPPAPSAVGNAGESDDGSASASSVDEKLKSQLNAAATLTDPDSEPATPPRALPPASLNAPPASLPPEPKTETMQSEPTPSSRAPVSELSKQEQKFISADAPMPELAQPDFPEGATLVDEVATQIVTRGRDREINDDTVALPRNNTAMLVAAALAVLLLAGVTGFLFWDAAGAKKSGLATAEPSNVSDPPPPPVAKQDAGFVDEKVVDSARPSTPDGGATIRAVVANQTRTPSARRGRSRRKAKVEATTTPKKADPSPSAAEPPEPAAKPPIEAKAPPAPTPEPIPPPAPPVVETKPPPKVYSLREDLRTVSQCKKGCTSVLEGLLSNTAIDDLNERNKKAIRFCAARCRASQ